MLLNRKTDLHVYGPKGIKEIILLQLRLGNSYTGYNLYFHELESKESEVIFEDEKVLVKTIPLKHRIYTNGFLFQEKMGDRKLNIDAVKANNIDTCYFQKIKNGKDIILESGTIIPNAALTFDPISPKSYAYCSDTQYDESIISLIENADVLYHESTFLETEADKAEKTMHSTAKEAATIAFKGNVKQLILGHYSTRYSDIQLFKNEASDIFLNTLLADDGTVFDFD
jgi:ribonuclease Z